MEGKNRFGFGVFSVDGEQISDADIAIYAAHGPTGKAEGPYPARPESLETEPAFTAATTANDPDAAQAVYVTELDLNQPGEWRLLAVIDQGDGFVSTRVPSAVAVTADKDKIPDVGEQAPVIHTPTTDDVGNVSEIDTRIPPSSMHDVDFADAVGKEPVALLFATPALCQSRVCGPVVDVTEQVKRDRPDDAAYIHMEIWNDNDPNKGAREQVLDYNLQTEPWLFVVNSDGTVSSRIEGAFSADELNAALDNAEAAEPRRTDPDGRAIGSGRGDPPLRHRRRRLRRLRARQPPHRGSLDPSPVDRGRGQGPQPQHQDPRGVPEPVPHRARLGLLDRARARGRQPLAVHPPREVPGRVELDERDALRPRPAARLRPLGRAGRARLGLVRRPALLPALRGQRARPLRVPRDRW